MRALQCAPARFIMKQRAIYDRAAPTIGGLRRAERLSGLLSAFPLHRRPLPTQLLHRLGNRRGRGFPRRLRSDRRRDGRAPA